MYHQIKKKHTEVKNSLKSVDKLHPVQKTEVKPIETGPVTQFTQKPETSHEKMKYLYKFSSLSLFLDNEQMDQLAEKYSSNHPWSGFKYDLGVVAGAVWGIGEGLVNTVIALKDLLVMLYQLEKAWLGTLWDHATSPVESIKKDLKWLEGAGAIAETIGKALINDPGLILEFFAAIGDMISDFIASSVEEWLEKGEFDQGFAIGRGLGIVLFEVIIAVLGTKGADKLAKAAKSGKFIALLEKLNLGKLNSLIDKVMDVKKLIKIGQNMEKMEDLASLGSSKKLLTSAIGKFDNIDGLMGKLNGLGDELPKIVKRLSKEDDLVSFLKKLDGLEADKYDEFARIIKNLDNYPDLKMDDILKSSSDDITRMISGKSVGSFDVKQISLSEFKALVKKNPDSAMAMIDDVVNELGTSIKKNPLRQEYENSVKGLKDMAEKLLKDGLSEEEVARKMSQMRRDLGVKYKDLTPPLLREYIYEVNMTRYKDPLGPSPEFLRRAKRKSWSDIIDSSTRPNGDVDKLLGGFKEWLINKMGI